MNYVLSKLISSIKEMSECGKVRYSLLINIYTNKLKIKECRDMFFFSFQ